MGPQIENIFYNEILSQLLKKLNACMGIFKLLYGILPIPGHTVFLSSTNGNFQMCRKTNTVHIQQAWMIIQSGQVTTSILSYQEFLANLEGLLIRQPHLFPMFPFP